MDLSKSGSTPYLAALSAICLSFFVTSWKPRNSYHGVSPFAAGLSAIDIRPSFPTLAMIASACVLLRQSCWHRHLMKGAAPWHPVAPSWAGHRAIVSSRLGPVERRHRPLEILVPRLVVRKYETRKRLDARMTRCDLPGGLDGQVRHRALLVKPDPGRSRGQEEDQAVPLSRVASRGSSALMPYSTSRRIVLTSVDPL